MIPCHPVSEDVMWLMRSVSVSLTFPVHHLVWFWSDLCRGSWTAVWRKPPPRTRWPQIRPSGRPVGHTCILESWSSWKPEEQQSRVKNRRRQPRLACRLMLIHFTLQLYGRCLFRQLALSPRLTHLLRIRGVWHDGVQSGILLRYYKSAEYFTALLPLKHECSSDQRVCAPVLWRDHGCLGSSFWTRTAVDPYFSTVVGWFWSGSTHCTYRVQSRAPPGRG